MKAIVVDRPHQYTLKEIHREKASQGQVRLRVKHIGFCASDVKILRGKHPFAKYPLIPGHEFSGEVIEAGDGCTLKKGDRVAVFPLFGCESCDPCQRDEVNRCQNLGIVGVNRNGGFCEEIVIDEKHLLRIPKNMMFEQAALAEPVAVALRACNRGECGSGNRIAVLGAGTIGPLIIQVSVSRGANVLLATDQFDNRLQLAKEFGVVNTINVTKEDRNIARRKPSEYNVVFDCVGTEETFRQAVDLACSGGKIILVGLPFGEWKGMPISEFFRKELSLIVTRVYNRAEFTLAIDLLAKGTVDTSRIITHRLDMTNLKDALSLMEHSQQSAIKIVLTP